MTFLVCLLIFAAAGGAIFAGWSLVPMRWKGDSQRMLERVETEFASKKETSAASPLFRSLDPKAFNSMSLDGTVSDGAAGPKRRPSLRNRLETLLDKSCLPYSFRQMVNASGLFRRRPGRSRQRPVRILRRPCDRHHRVHSAVVVGLHSFPQTPGEISGSATRGVRPHGPRDPDRAIRAAGSVSWPSPSTSIEPPIATGLGAPPAAAEPGPQSREVNVLPDGGPGRHSGAADLRQRR